MKNYVIIVAGGSGKRMLAAIPKQFLPLAGKPILAHTIRAFRLAMPDIDTIVALPRTEIQRWKDLCRKFAIPSDHTIAVGGETRFHSVMNSLRFVQHEGIVGIHDGVRPLVSKETIISCYEAAAKLGNAIPVIPVNDSLRKISPGSSAPVDRSQYRIVQTPQCFRSTIIKDAYSGIYDEQFTDDAMVVEAAGGKINLVKGNPENIKITTPADLKMAESLLPG